MEATQKGYVESLLAKAADAKDAPQAVNYAQAACNAANAMRVLSEIELAEKAPRS